MWQAFTYGMENGKALDWNIKCQPKHVIETSPAGVPHTIIQWNHYILSSNWAKFHAETSSLSLFPHFESAKYIQHTKTWGTTHTLYIVKCLLRVQNCSGAFYLITLANRVYSVFMYLFKFSFFSYTSILSWKKLTTWHTLPAGEDHVI